MLEKQRTLFKIKYHVQFKLLYMMLYMEKQLYIHKKHNTKSHGFFKDNDKYWNFSIITFFYGIMNVSTNKKFKIVDWTTVIHGWMPDSTQICVNTKHPTKNIFLPFSFLSNYTKINLIMGRTKYTRISIEMIEWG
jgi:hypothetical protein